MEAVGSEVFFVLMPIFTIMTLTAFTFRNQISQILRKAYIYVFG